MNRKNELANNIINRTAHNVGSDVIPYSPEISAAARDLAMLVVNGECKSSVETIDWHDEEARKTWLGHILIALITTNDKEYWQKNPKPDSKNMHVECRIDGVAVNLSEVVEEMGRDFERQVEYAARELVRERFSKIDDFLYRLKNSIESEFPYFLDE